MKYYLLHVLSLSILLSPLNLSSEGTRSWKRGVSANNLTQEQVQALAPGVSWIYNWGSSPGNIQVTDEMEFIPMVWGFYQSQLDGVKAYLDGGAEPSSIFFLNEPNFEQPLGSFVSPQDSAEWLETVRTTLADYSDIPIIGPHMALGGAADESITAFDPIQQTEVTYTTGTSFLDAYDWYVGDDPAHTLSFHTYVDSEMEYWVDTFFDRAGKPVWVTEFAWWNAPDVDSLLEYMVETLDYLERSPKVERYAWFKADLGSRNKLSLLETTGATLTRPGELYVNYPAYDPDHYYPVPGKIEAESHSGLTNMKLSLSDSDDGWGAMSIFATRREGWLTYQIDVAEAGTYRWRMRTTNSLYEDLGPVEPTESDPDPPQHFERDLYFETRLEPGEQIFRVWVKGFNAKIDWLEFFPLEN